MRLAAAPTSPGEDLARAGTRLVGPVVGDIAHHVAHVAGLDEKGGRTVRTGILTLGRVSGAAPFLVIAAVPDRDGACLPGASPMRRGNSP